MERLERRLRRLEERQGVGQERCTVVITTLPPETDEEEESRKCEEEEFVPGLGIYITFLGYGRSWTEAELEELRKQLKAKYGKKEGEPNHEQA